MTTNRGGSGRETESPEAWLRTVAAKFARSRFRRRMILERLVRSGRLRQPETAAPTSPDWTKIV